MRLIDADALISRMIWILRGDHDFHRTGRIVNEIDSAASVIVINMDDYIKKDTIESEYVRKSDVLEILNNDYLLPFRKDERLRGLVENAKGGESE